MLICRICKTKRDGKFCWMCGCPLVKATPTCPDGHSIYPHDSFCRECGLPVNDEAAKTARNNRLAAELAQEPATEAPWDERMG